MALSKRYVILTQTISFQKVKNSPAYVIMDRLPNKRSYRAASLLIKHIFNYNRMLIF